MALYLAKGLYNATDLDGRDLADYETRKRLYGLAVGRLTSG